jgi:transcriptional regulator with XRE-family HTH domain
MTSSTSGGKPFGELLRDLRVAAGRTQEELAEAAGLSTRALGGLERATGRRPQRRTVELVAKALGLSGEEADELVAAARAARPEAEATDEPGTSVS